MSIENHKARKLEETAFAQSDDLAVRLELGKKLASVSDLQGVFAETLRVAAFLSGTERGTFSLVSDSGDCLNVAASIGFSPDFVEILTRVLPGSGACGRCMQENCRIVIEDTETDPRFEVNIIPIVSHDGTVSHRAIEKSSDGLGIGIGIGLALVKGLIEMRGGTVTAESAGQGQGSTFTIRLPCLKPRQNSETGKTPSSEHLLVAKGRRVLVVDDNRDAADSMALMLGLLGDEVRTAHDGNQAIDAAKDFRPEIILMDIGMPGMNGLDATRHIRALDWGQTVKIVALTVWGQESDRERTKDAGCDRHLIKPVSLSELEEMLQ